LACEAAFKTTETDSEAYYAQLDARPGSPLGPGYTATPGIAPPGVNYPNAQILDLMGTVTYDGGSPEGPWLKEYPYDAGYFQIGVTKSTSAHPSAVFVGKPDGQGKIPATPTYSIADCSHVRANG
jgi:hypothetical protein